MASETAARAKVTVTLNRRKASAAKVLIGARSISEVIDVALDRLIRGEELRRDVATYSGKPLTDEELSYADLPVEFDLDDDDIDYDKLYAKRR